MRSETQCTTAMAVKVFAAQLLEEPVAASLRTGCWADDAKRAITAHWPEYMIEAICLGTFMISACAFSALLEHPASPVRASVMSADIRRFLVGLAMGITAILLIYSPLGRRSGAHMNPATTLTFYRLGKVEGWDAFFYMLSQFTGGDRAGLRRLGADAGSSRRELRDYSSRYARRIRRFHRRDMHHVPSDDGHIECFE